MSLRNITVQYVGGALRLPMLERDVTLVVTEDGRRFVPERTCEVECVKSGPMFDVWRYPCCGIYTDSPMGACPKCGAKVEEMR